MTLATLLEQTGHYSQPYGKGGAAVQVFPYHGGRDTTGLWRYWRLSDYVVTSAVSGPSIVLVPRKRPEGREVAP